jgi:hypothetical protein
VGEVGVQTDLVAFLLACIEEDERRAYEYAQGTTTKRVMTRGHVEETPMPGPWQEPVWPPARVLVECDTKRRILAECKYWYDKVERGEDYPALADRFEVAMSVLRLLALPYRDRPGYRAEWSPDGR